MRRALKTVYIAGEIILAASLAVGGHPVAIVGTAIVSVVAFVLVGVFERREGIRWLVSWLTCRIALGVFYAMAWRIDPAVGGIYATALVVMALPLIWLPGGATKSYVIRRLLLIVPTFLGISLISFAVIQLAPGSPIYFKLMGGQGNLASDSNTEKIIEDTKRLYGLDKSIPEQYVLWLGRLVKFDFGQSYKDRRPVRDKILETLPITLQINIIAILLVYVISVPIGVYSATHQNSWGDAVLTLVLFVLYSLPSFWIAMLLILFLGGGEYLNWFPIYGISSLGADEMSWPRWLLDRGWHLVLPVFCLTYGGLAGLSRYARAGMIETIRQDYIRTARAYGFSEKVVVFKYAMRNSLIPILTLLGTLLPALIGGSVIIEQIFSIPGMGRLGFEAILSRDYPLIMGILSISALLTLVGLLLSDLMYALTDPRIRFE